MHKLLESVSTFYKKGLSISTEFDRNLYLQHSNIQKEQGSKLLEKIVPLKESINILDIGCGDGNVTFKLAKLFPNCTIYAIDKSKTQIEIANKNFHSTNISFVEQDLYKLNYINKFNIVFSNSAMHWILDQKKHIK